MNDEPTLSPSLKTKGFIITVLYDKTLSSSKNHKVPRLSWKHCTVGTCRSLDQWPTFWPHYSSAVLGLVHNIFYLRRVATGSQCKHMLQRKNRKNFYSCVAQRFSKFIYMHFWSQHDASKILWVLHRYHHLTAMFLMRDVTKHCLAA